MPKDRMERRNSKPQKVKPLEVLIRSDESTLYGQVCWSLANNSTVIHEPGDVISIPTTVVEDQHIEERFRLTKTSLTNIAKCFGMKTCGEAVDLFTKKREVKPWGECQGGHREAAFQFMMYGIEPSEPCPDCGQIPRFGDLSRTLGFYEGEVVRGVDGQEYSECPECGSDFLELQGESIVKWGWRIVCGECGWEIKQSETLDIRQYCDLMEDVKNRVKAIEQLMELPGITNRTRVESVSLQLRMLLELIVFSSLVSNKDVWQRSHKELQSSQNIHNKLRELKRIHPDFYPKPVDLQQSAAVGEPVTLTRGFLGEDELIGVYGRLGNILHADNPLGKETDYRYFLDTVPEWLEQVKKLLECHKVYLYHHPDRFYLVKMFGDADGELVCIPFKTATIGKAKCAWPDCVSNRERRYCEAIRRPWRECNLPELEPQQTEGKASIDQIGLDPP